MRRRTAFASSSYPTAEVVTLRTGLSLLHPVHAIILSTGRADIRRLLWPGADTPLVVDDAVHAVVGDEVIRCHAFLHRRDKRFERVSLVASGAVATMAHSGKT